MKLLLILCMLQMLLIPIASLRFASTARRSIVKSTSRLFYDATTIKASIESYKTHPNNNIPSSIADKVGSNLHLQPQHPLNLIKQQIEDYCHGYAVDKKFQFKIYDDLNPIVDTINCFDYLRVGPDHVSRRPSDTYYLTNEQLLRTHTSAHQIQFISQGNEAFLCTGDVYRRDEIDASHYPVFHQMEGVRIFPESSFPAHIKTLEEKKKYIEQDLKDILTGLARHLFGDVEMRWNEDYFPFTEPSFELEVLFNGDWLEVLGCGVIHKEVMANAKKENEVGWAFGLGLERLAMILFGIPDIRLFWTKDERFMSQFRDVKDIKTLKFQPYSKYPLCYKDVSFWLPMDKEVHQNDIFEVIRNLGGDLVEKVELFDEFTNPKTNKQSKAYRVIYRSMDRSLTNEEVDAIQNDVRNALVEKLSVTLR